MKRRHWRRQRKGTEKREVGGRRWKTTDRPPLGSPWGLRSPLQPFLTPNSGARWGSADGRVSPTHTQTPKAMSTKTWDKADNQIMSLQRSQWPSYKTDEHVSVVVCVYVNVCKCLDSDFFMVDIVSVTKAKKMHHWQVITNREERNFSLFTTLLGACACMLFRRRV